MPFTVQNLSDEALRLIHVQRANQSFATATSGPNTIPGSQEYQICIDALNQILDGFSVDGATIYQLAHDSATLTGLTTYTIGPSGAINTVRPEKIRGAAVIQTDGSMPIEVVSVERWNRIIDRSVTGSFAEMLLCDYQYPLATLYIWPAPNSGTLDLWSFKPFSSVTYLSDTINLPPGYYEVLKFNLAVAIASEFPGGVLDQWVVQKAVEAKQRLAALNMATIGSPEAPLMPSAIQVPLREIDLQQAKPAIP